VISEDPHTDGWIECSELTMQMARDPSILVNALESLWPPAVRHTCTQLRDQVDGKEIEAAKHYPNYASGARHLEALALTVVELSALMNIYRWLSYGSVAFMLVAALWAAPRTAVVIMLPIATALAFAFEQHRYAYSLAFAPAFFVAFFLLGVFLIARSFFE